MLSEIRKIRDEVKLQLEMLGVDELNNENSKKKSLKKDEEENKVLSSLEKSRLEVKALTDSIIQLANKKAPDVNVDFSGFIKALSELKNAIPKYEKQEIKDYTELLQEVVRVIDKPVYDYSKIESLLDVISKKEFVLPLDDKGRVKVSVDKVSMGGRGSLSSTESAKLLTLATEAKQDEIIAALGGGAKIKKIDEALPYTYIGEAAVGTATSAASWRIKRVDDTSDPDSTILYAGTGAFDQVWDNRSSLTYN